MKQFEQVQVQRPQQSHFDLSHEKKLSLKMGDLIPIMMEEVIPGDTFTVRAEILTRVQAMLAPIMHRVSVYTHFFFVPNRLIWEEWEQFITGDFDGADETSIPQIIGTWAEQAQYMGQNSLADYMGIPSLVSASANAMDPINVLPFRAYKKIFKDYYADENHDTTDELDTATVQYPLIGGGDLMEIRKRNWEKDYFTSALPWAQRGQAVTLPLGDYAPVENYNYNKAILNKIDGTLLPTAYENLTVSGSKNSLLTDTAGSDLDVHVDVSGSHRTDLSQATAATISTVRTAFALQRWQEKNARGGVRYTELILSHFGVRSKDSRLQRAEYLGGGKLSLRISEVLQTSESGTTPLGEFAGHGYAEGSSPSFRSFHTEHGIIMGIMSVMPRTGYFQGQPKYFAKKDRYDFFWPNFAHIGEQPIANREIFLQTDGTTVNANTFGYQPRYDEYRYKHDSIHGEFKGSLDYWHLARKFSSLPTLSEDFIKANVTNRFLAVQDSEDYLLSQIWLDIKATRPIPKFGNPM